MSELPELIQALLNPRLYPEPPQRVELVQTQMSYVLLAGDYAYKLKKPVNLGYLDYTTLEKRRALCYKETELNRRLCPDAYLGVVEITYHHGHYALGGEGGIVEYAVRMRRLPAARMLDYLLPRGEATPAMLADVARLLADFHARAATGREINKIGGLNAVIQNTEENFAQTEKYFGEIIAPETYEHLKGYTRNFIAANEDLFRQRVAAGRVRDCHGDLHAAHVCFTERICIYDCIEFNDRFRYTDVAAEVAFLAMDLDHYGRGDLSRAFVVAYVTASGDRELVKLLNFYKCYRAYVRGKVGCFQYDDPQIPAAEKERIRRNARGYFKLAESYIE